MDKKALTKYYIYDFLFDHDKLLSTCEATLLLPDKVYRLEGSGSLTREHFCNLNDRARSFIEKHDARQKRLAEQTGSTTQPQPSPQQAPQPPPQPKQTQASGSGAARVHSVG